MFKPYSFLLITFLLTFTTYSQLDTLFWFVAPDVLQSHADRPIVFRFASLEKASVITVSQPANPSFPTQTINLAANSSNTLDLTPWINMVENKPSDTKLNYGFKIRASEPITAYYEVNTLFNPEIFALKGTNALGFRFIVPAQNFMNNRAGATSGFNIVATEDNTSITITPTKNIKGHLANIPFTIILNKGETYFAEAASLAGADHLSGSQIKSNKKIAVTVHDDSVIGTPLGGGCQDLMGDQLIPINLFGKEYIAIKGYLRNPDRVCLFAVNDNTLISIDGSNVATLNKGESYTHLLSNPTAYVSASDSISVLHVSGFGCEAGQAILPQIHCTGSFTVPFVRSTNDFIAINILVPAGAEDGFLINGLTGKINASSFSFVPGTNNRWMFAKIDISGFFPLTQKIFKVENAKNKFQLGIIHGTSSSGCRYGFFSGFSTLKYKAEANKIDLCERDTIKLFSNVFDNASYKWKGPDAYSNSGQSIMFPAVKNKNSGWYKLYGYEENTCNIIPDSIYINVNKNDSLVYTNSVNICTSKLPYIWRGQTILNEGVYRSLSPNIVDCIDSVFYLNLSVNKFSAGSDLQICKGDSLKLNGTGGVSYTWNNGVVNDVFFKPLFSLRYLLTAQDQNGCKDTSSVFVKVNELPYVSISNDTVVCEDDFPFVLYAKGTGVFTWYYNNLESGNNASVNVTSLGLYKVKLIDLNGCINSTQFNVSTFSLPNVLIDNISRVTQLDCINQSINLTASGGVKYYWTDGTNKLNEKNEITIVDSGDYHVFAIDNNNCKSSSNITITKDLSKPIVSITNNTGVTQIDCLNSNISLTAAGGINYIWYDSGSIIGNTNQISISEAGTYEVLATSASTGCTEKSTIALTKDITKPQVSIINNTKVTQIDCNNPFISLIATGGGNYLWSDGVTSIANTDQITISEAGKYEVMVTSSTTGCSEKSQINITKDINKPIVTIYNNSGVSQIDCKNPFISLIASGGDSYVWTDGFNTISNSDQISVSEAGSYEVTVTSTLNGCINKSLIQLTKDLSKPLATIINSSGVTQLDCNHPMINLTASGGGTYQWSKINSIIGNSDQISINEEGTYEVLVTSSTTGCKEKSTINITKDFSKPIVSIINITGVTQIDCNNPLISLKAIGGINYLWFNSSKVIGNNDQISLSNAGLYEVVVTSSSTGCQNQESIVLTKKPINPDPPKLLIESGKTVFCEGDSVVIRAFSPEIGDYEWRKGTNVLSTNSFITIKESGLYSVNVKIAGCSSVFNDTLIQVNIAPPKPTIIKTPEFCLSEKATLDSLTKKMNGVGIKWFDENSNSLDYNYILKDGESYFAVSNSLDACASLQNEKVTVKVKSNPNIPSASLYQEFCFNENKKVSDLMPQSSTLIKIEWYKSSVKQVSTNPLENNLYVAYALKDGCISEQSIEVNVKVYDTPKPINSTQILCSNNTIQPILADLYPNFTNYFFYKKSNLSEPPVPNQTILNDGDKYFVRSSINGCLSEPLEILISLSKGPAIGNLTYNLIPALCLKDKPTLDLVESKYSNLPSAKTLFWYSGQNDQLELYLPKNTTILTGVYWLALKGEDGCFSKKQQVNITIDEGQKPLLKPIDLCSLNEYTISDLNIANLTSQQGELIWYDSNISNVKLQQNEKLNRYKEYWAAYILSNSNCEHSERIKLPISWIYYNDEIKLEDTKQIFCINNQSMISDLNTKPYEPNQISWFIDENSDIPLLPNESIYEIPYYVALTKKTSDNNFCISSNRQKIDVTYYTPKVYPIVKGSICGKKTGTIEFVNIKNDISVSWYNMNDSTVLDFNGLKYPKPLDNQSFKLIFKDTKGCIDSLKITIPECYVDTKPQIVTPDNDGNNDTWKIGYYLKYEKVQVKIYNRWGNKVYESDIPYMDNWNGFYKNEFLPSGTYYFMIDKGNGEESESGFIELVK